MPRRRTVIAHLYREAAYETCATTVNMPIYAPASIAAPRRLHAALQRVGWRRASALPYTRRHAFIFSIKNYARLSIADGATFAGP